MATFLSLTPSLGSVANRTVPEIFVVELELLLPQDFFLPATDIIAQVWTNLIHRQNPDGPKVWQGIPMKLSQLVTEKQPDENSSQSNGFRNGHDANSNNNKKSTRSVAHFTARLQPTGSGTFGLTVRFKNHLSQPDWTWVGTEKENVEIKVRLPKSFISNSWTLGPQSVMVFGTKGPRTGISDGPGLYLGNHAAANLSRKNGYDAVLSIVSDLMDFDEKIPADQGQENNKNLWKQPPLSEEMKKPPMLTKRTSVSDLMVKEPLPRSTSVNHHHYWEIEDTPRLSRKNSVTEMMVQAPKSESLRKTRASGSISALSSLMTDNEELTRETTQEVASPQQASPPGPAPNLHHSKNSNHNNNVTTPAPATATTATTTTTTGTTASTTQKPASKKKGAKNVSGNNHQTPTTPVIATTHTTTGPATVLTPPVSAKATKPPTTPATPTTTTHSDKGKDEKDPSAVVKASHQSAPTSSSSTTAAVTKTAEATVTTTTNTSVLLPPTSAKVIATIQQKELLTPLSSTTITDDFRPGVKNNTTTTSKPFQHKIISLPPGAHNKISDRDLKLAIEFLDVQLSQGKKVMVHCRDGNGRSGSIAVAYVAYKQSKKLGSMVGKESWSFEKSLQEVWKFKCDVYPHTGLKESVEKLMG